MSRILMINVPFSGHVNPTLPLAAGLVKRGHAVDYICSEQFRTAIEKTGADFIPYSSFPAKPTMRQNKRLSFQAAFNTAMELGNEYDLLIYEMLFYPGIKLAQNLQIPCVRQFSQPAWSEASMKNASKLFDLSVRLIDAQVMGKKKRQSMGLSFSSMKDAVLYSKPDLNIVYIPEKFQNCRESFDETFHFVVPRQKPITGSIEIPYDKMKPPIVYISLGSIISSKRFCQKCLRAFGNKDVSVILNTGKVKPEKLGDIASNIYAYSFVPQIEVLEHADVFLTHCGMNSVNEAICAGVPMIAMPFVNDQIENARQMERLRIGKRIPTLAASTEEIEKAVEEVWKDKTYKTNIEQIGLDEYKNPEWENIVEQIEILCNQKIQSHRTSCVRR
ncbi:MAG: glycosyltransferase [bacterium]|nr:glycosyltransferase [bacterium]